MVEERDSCKTDPATFKAEPALSGDNLQWASPVFYQLLSVVEPVLNPENYMIASSFASFLIKSNMWNTMLVNKAFYQAGRAGRSTVEGMQVHIRDLWLLA